MKVKSFLLLVFSFLFYLSTFAIPSGVYSDEKGNRFLVDNHNVIHFLDKEGKVTSRMTIISEETVENGIQFVTKDEYGITRHSNGCWVENGDIYINLQNKRRTYKKND